MNSLLKALEIYKLKLLPLLIRGAVIFLLFTPAALTADEPAIVEKVAIELTIEGGQILTGKRVMENDSIVVLELNSGSRITVEKSGIKSVKEHKEGHFDFRGRLVTPDPNRTRYLFAPSAMMLNKGEMKFSQKELLWSSYSVGVVNNFSLEIGGAVPLWFAEEGEGINILLAAKGGGRIKGPLYLAGGILTFSLPVSQTIIGLPFGSVTVGNSDFHGTFTASVPFVVEESDFETGEFYWFAICGNARLSSRVALVSENWVFRIDNEWFDDTEFILNLAVRFLGKRFSTDVGMFFNSEFYMPLPWVGFTLHLRS